MQLELREKEDAELRQKEVGIHRIYMHILYNIKWHTFYRLLSMFQQTQWHHPIKTPYVELGAYMMAH